VPILVDEVLRALAPRAGERGVDCTLGFGGHAERLLERLRPGGALLALDADPLVHPRTVARLAALGHGPETLHARRTNFAGVLGALAEIGWEDGADVLLADLGVSSMQLDDPARGFTHKHAGPLDMRMNPRRGASAAEWLARADEDELAAVLEEHSDEPHAARIARALCALRGELDTTGALARAVRTALAGRADEDEIERSVRRTFQAVRIAVNDELGVLEALLRDLPRALRPGGRAALITFHSGEDRRVKKAFERGLADGTFSAIAPEPVRASAEERRANPRSSSAKLRWARRA
jgi:16S rRNA (cytosine1402-N4)-methyltransferase